MDAPLRLVTLALEQVSAAEHLLSRAGDAAWVGPSAEAYRARLEERRVACAVLRLRLEGVRTVLLTRAAL